MRGSSLVIRPVPLGSVSGALTHIFRAAEPRLVTGSDVPLMPHQFHDAIADKAANLGYMRQGDLPEAKGFQELTEEWITAMIANADRFADSPGGGARTEVEGK
jgi:hypothetical protein